MSSIQLSEQETAALLLIYDFRVGECKVVFDDGTRVAVELLSVPLLILRTALEADSNVKKTVGILRDLGLVELNGEGPVSARWELPDGRGLRVKASFTADKVSISGKAAAAILGRKKTPLHRVLFSSYRSRISEPLFDRYPAAKLTRDGLVMARDLSAVAGGKDKATKPMKPKIRLNRRKQTIHFNGTLLRLNSEHAFPFIRKLYENRGNPVKATTFSNMGFRPERVWKGLPKPLRDCVSKPGRGQSGYLIP
jgi:hypothetical protein